MAFPPPEPTPGLPKSRRFLTWLPVIAWLGLCVAGKPLALASQAGPLRTTLDSLQEVLSAVNQAGGLPGTMACSKLTSTAARLCTVLIELRGVELGGTVDGIAEVRDHAERAVGEEPDWALGWWALGRVRLAAGRAGMVGREGPLQFAGTDNWMGAAAVFEEALKHDPYLVPAARALALSPVAWNNQSAIHKRIALLRKINGLLEGDALVGAAVFELDGGGPAEAVKLLDRALSDTTVPLSRGWAQLVMARAYYRMGKQETGRKALLAGAAATDSIGMREYSNLVALVGDSAEMGIWGELPPENRTKWLTTFWSKRDVRDGRGDGERLVEHFRRVEVASQRYRMILPFAGQQRMLSNLEESEYTRWLIKQWPPDVPTELLQEYLSARNSVGAQSPFKVFQSGQVVFDDRGLVYIRHGEPTRRLSTGPAAVSLPQQLAAGSDSSPAPKDSSWYRPTGPQMEIWRYDRPAPLPPLLLTFMNKPFQGTVEPNVLVATLAAEDPATRSAFCSIDHSLCPLTTSLVTEIVAGNMSPAKVAEARDRGLKVIAEAVTSDAYAREFGKALHPSISAHILEQYQSGVPRLVVAYAIPAKEIVPEQTKKESVTFSMRMEIQAVRLSDGLRVRRDSTRRFTIPVATLKDQFVSGVLELPLSSGIWNGSVVFTIGGIAGAVVALDSLRVAGPIAHLVLGDLVLGRPATPLRWQAGPGGEAVPLNPFTTIPAGEVASLYLQVGGLNPGQSFGVRVEIIPGSHPDAAPAITLTSKEEATASRQELLRMLGLEQLAPGKYLVRVTVTSGGEEATSVAGLEVGKGGKE